MRRPQDAVRPLSDDHYEVFDLEIPGLSDLRLWLFDLEATGLDTSRERITQIAGMPLQGGRLIEEEAFTQYVHPGPGVEIPREVEELTGITLETLEGAPPFPKAWEACLEAARASDLWIGQSVFEFDVPLLETELARHGLPVRLPPVLDTVVLATALLGQPETRWSTSALISHFAVDTSGLRRHDALDDVKILGRILLPMLEAYREGCEDRLHVPSSAPLLINRHPPVRTEGATGTG